MSHRAASPNGLRAFRMPFTANRQFKAAPRLFVAAKGMYCATSEGRQVLDGTAGLWCCNAGHRRPRVTEAIREQAGALDHAPAFRMGRPKAFELANRLIGIAPAGMEHAFFASSGSEAVETALKIAIAYQRAIGQGTRSRLIGRERGYHGVNCGGISVGGIVADRKAFDAARRRRSPAPHASSRAERLLEGPAGARRGSGGGAGADRGAARPFRHRRGDRGAGGGLDRRADPAEGIPPAAARALRPARDPADLRRGHHRLRTGAAFAAEKYGVMPDMIACAKGRANGVIPMGAVLTTGAIHDAFMTGPEHAIELFHGYTCSGNPVAAAAGLATLDTCREEGLFERAAAPAPFWQEALHSLRGLPQVIDIRNEGLIGAVALEPIPGAPTRRAFQAFLDAYDAGVLIRTTGDIIALSPPLIISEAEIDALVGALAEVLRKLR